VRKTTESATSDELVEFWEGRGYIGRNVQAVVISEDGWSWVLAWLQMGVMNVICQPTSGDASQQLSYLKEKPHFKAIITERNASEVIPAPENKITIIALHLSTLSLLDHLCALRSECERSANAPLVIMVSTNAKGAELLETKTRLADLRWQELRHTQLGGLTTARVWVGWTGLGTGVSPGTSKCPKRPLDRFLNPAARNVAWREPVEGTKDCWKPHSEGATPFPWPWKTSPEWVETGSVFSKGFIQRHFTPKERCQLTDVRDAWQDSIDNVWSWNQGRSPPLRLLVELISAAAPSIQKIGVERRIESDTMSVRDTVDWGRERAPWLGQRAEVDTHLQIDHLKYFGWIWDSADWLDISVVKEMMRT
jgi:hypothetical protein